MLYNYYFTIKINSSKQHNFTKKVTVTIKLKSVTRNKSIEEN